MERLTGLDEVDVHHQLLRKASPRCVHYPDLVNRATLQDYQQEKDKMRDEQKSYQGT